MGHLRGLFRHPDGVAKSVDQACGSIHSASAKLLQRKKEIFESVPQGRKQELGERLESIEKFDPALQVTRKRWNHLLTLMRNRWPKMCGLRVFEMHKFHGLHVHLLTDRFIDVNEARTMAAQAGWGRIHVKRMPATKAGYLGKYLSKDRPPCFKRWRLWAAFGTEWQWTKIGNLEKNSSFSRVYQYFKERYYWEGNRGFFEKMASVKLFINRQIKKFGQKVGPYDEKIRCAILSGGEVLLW